LRSLILLTTRHWQIADRAADFDMPVVDDAREIVEQTEV
jgi:hypothetical protein